MATILALGDSLTYGARPDAMARHALADRWPSVLAQEIGAEVIAEGMNGRTTVFSDPQAPGLRSAADALPTLLHSHAPLDLVIVMLGTNDIMVAERSARAAGRGMARLVEIIRHHPWWGEVQMPKILIVSPPPAVVAGNDGVSDREIFETRRLHEELCAVAAENGCAFFDAAEVAKASPLDGIHLDAKNTRAIGKALAPLVRDLLG